jgi:hypothetical protein
MGSGGTCGRGCEGSLIPPRNPAANSRSVQLRGCVGGGAGAGRAAAARLPAVHACLQLLHLRPRSWEARHTNACAERGGSGEGGAGQGALAPHIGSLPPRHGGTGASLLPGACRPPPLLGAQQGCSHRPWQGSNLPAPQAADPPPPTALARLPGCAAAPAAPAPHLYLRPVTAAARLAVCGLLKALKVAFTGVHTHAQHERHQHRDKLRGPGAREGCSGDGEVTGWG